MHDPVSKWRDSRSIKRAPFPFEFFAVHHCTNIYVYLDCDDFIPMMQQPKVREGILIIEASRLHSDTPHSVGLMRMSISPIDIILLDKTQHTPETDIKAPAGFEPKIRESERP